MNVLAAARITRVLCVYWVYIQGVVCWGMYVWGGVLGYVCVGWCAGYVCVGNTLINRAFKGVATINIIGGSVAGRPT